MVTGEGKTLVATLPCYLNALEGKGVHVVTCERLPCPSRYGMDGALYMGLGLTVGRSKATWRSMSGKIIRL